MTLIPRTARGLTPTRSLLDRLIATPDLARRIQALPARAFTALVDEVGLADAGELIALATTEQLLRTFDEDLFAGDRAGERERLDPARFATWLEVLLEAGDEAAADRVAALDEDLIALRLGGILRVLDMDALRAHVGDDERAARRVDRALESALVEELDAYLLVAQRHEGWDAALRLIVALDRDHHPLRVRLLDRLARLSLDQLEEPEALWTALSEAESLAEDVEAAREERRGKEGYVEPRAARAFLTLARQPAGPAQGPAARDPLTHAYFRGLDREQRAVAPATTAPPPRRALPALSRLDGDAVALAPPGARAPGVLGALFEALRQLGDADPALFDRRMEELVYLANVLRAGHERDGARLRPKAAADAALATVGYGAVLEASVRRGAGPPSAAELQWVLSHRSADLLFRRASAALASGAAPRVIGAAGRALLYDAEELEAAIR